MSYATTATKAAATLQKKGQVVTLRKVSAGTYTAGAVNVSTRDYSRFGVVFEMGSGTIHSGGALIQQGDKQLYLEAGVEPTMTDRVILANRKEYGIANIKELSPGGVPVMYELHLRAS